MRRAAGDADRRPRCRVGGSHLKGRAAACAALVCCAAQAAAVATPAVVLAEREIVGDEAYADAVVVLAGTIRVRAGASLTLERTEIVALPGARLIVLGDATIAGMPDAPARIRGGPAVVEVAGSLALTDVDVEGTTFSISGVAGLARTRISRAGGDLLTVTGALRARDVVLDAAYGVAIRGLDASLELDGVEVAASGGYGIGLRGGRAVVSRLAIANTLDYGVRADGIELHLSSSSFAGHCGVFLGPGATGSMQSLRFATHDRALTLFETGAVSVSDVAFDGGAVGLSIFGAQLDAVGVRASGVAQAVLSVDAAGRLEHGSLGGGVGVEVDGGGAVPVLRDVDFSAAGVGLRNRTSTTVDARWNFWGGVPGAPGSAGIEGPAEVDPWLYEPPA